MSKEEGLFMQREEERAKRAARELSRDPYIFSSLKNWNTLSDKEKKSVLGHIAVASADKLGVINPMQMWFDKPMTEDHKLLLGYFKSDGPYGPTIALNENAQALNRPVHEIIGVITHENTHYRQMAGQDMKEPVVPLSVLEKMDAEFRSYVSGENHSIEVYRAQLVERHANLVGNTMEREFAATLSNTNKVHLSDDSYYELQEEFNKYGDVRIPRVNCVECTDPRRYQLHAQALAKKMRRKTAAPHEINAYVEALNKAVLYAEHTTGLHEPKEAVYDTFNFLQNPPPNASPEILARAEKNLRRYAASPNPHIRNKARTLMNQSSPAPTAHRPTAQPQNHASPRPA